MKKGNEIKKNEYIDLVTLSDFESPVTEQYRAIRTNIQFAYKDKNLKSLAIISAQSNEGKSITAGNLAVVFASTGARVLLVDANMRQPKIHTMFNLQNNKGLSTLLTNKTSKLTDTINVSSTNNLKILTSGPDTSMSAELLDSERMDGLMSEIGEKFDLAIFDLPPIIPYTDGQIIANKVDGTVLVVLDKISQKKDLFRAKNLLENVNAKILGVVYNEINA